MKLTKYGHACVALEKDGRKLVIDAGAFTPEDALAGADAALVTHEHLDHFVEDKIRAAAEANPALVVWTSTAVAGQLVGLGDQLKVVGAGDAFSTAGFDVHVHGELHAVIHPDLPRVRNIGFLVDGDVFHPGDALTVPDERVENLLLPVHAPWSKLGELIDYVREVKPSQVFALHDGLLNDTGLQLTSGWFGERGPGTGAPFTRLAPGESYSTLRA
jgi:L-ascorbate metabolism protein UlaG (beta-lactamase superfamily)